MTSVYFRCDAGAVDGLGHLRRCLSLSDALSQRGLHSMFVVSAGEGQIGADILRKASVPYLTSHGPVGSEKDFEGLTALGLKPAPTTMVLDSKRGHVFYHDALRDMFNLTVIDDDGGTVSADLVVNSRLDASPSLYSADSTVERFAFGGAFNFVPAALFDREPAEDPFSVLITMGGEDPQNRTAWIVETLAAQRPDLPLRVVVGPSHPNKPSVAEEVSRHPRAVLVDSPNGLSEEISRCTVAISAGGTTCYELSAARRGFAIVLLEDHQEPFALPFFDSGAAILSNTVTDWDSAKLVATVDKLCLAETRTAMTIAQRGLLPSSGLGNVADAIIKTTTVRKT